MRILTAGQSREAERIAIDAWGVPAIVLMETAGRAVVEAIGHSYPTALDGRVAVVCGRGNNGGDGFVVARTLHERGVAVDVCVVGQRGSLRDEAKVNAEILDRLGVPVIEIADAGRWEAHRPAVAASALVVDALLGTGVDRPLSGLLAMVVSDINAMEVPVVAVDLPSGLSADTPVPPGVCVHATSTVTFTALKHSLAFPPGAALAGDIVVAQIGIARKAVERVGGRRVEMLAPDELRPMVPQRTPSAHKGECGRVTVVAGSRGKTGAAYLAAMGALRSGAGLVTIATPRSCQPVLAAMAPEYMTVALPETADGVVGEDSRDQLRELRHDVIVCGPGLGTTDGARAVVREVLAVPGATVVLDADALTLLAESREWIRQRIGPPVVVTPHPGEMARLLDRSASDVQARRLDAAVDLATGLGVVVVLKGHRTLVATPAGTVAVNPTGGPGLATGGTGDVLAGVIGAWVAQTGDVERACRLGVYLHGRAGDMAQQAEGEVAMTASSVLNCLGPAVRELTGEPSPRGALRWLRT